MHIHSNKGIKTFYFQRNTINQPDNSKYAETSPKKKLRDSRLRDKNSIVVVFLTFREKSKNLDTIQAVI